MFVSLDVFVARENHANVSPQHVENGMALGAWLDRQLKLREAGALPPWRDYRLRQAGVDWDHLSQLLRDCGEGASPLCLGLERGFLKAYCCVVRACCEKVVGKAVMIMPAPLSEKLSSLREASVGSDRSSTSPNSKRGSLQATSGAKRQSTVQFDNV